MSFSDKFVSILSPVQEVDGSGPLRRSIQPTASHLSMAQTPRASPREALTFNGQCLELGGSFVKLLKQGSTFHVHFSGVTIDSKFKIIVRDVIKDFNSLLVFGEKNSRYCLKFSDTVLNLGEDYKRLNELVSLLVRETCELRPMYESYEQKCELEQSSLNVISSEDEQLTILQAAIIEKVKQFRDNPDKDFSQFDRSNNFFCKCVGKSIGVNIKINLNFGVIFFQINRGDSRVLNQQRPLFKVDRREGPIDVFFTKFEKDLSLKLPTFYTRFSCSSSDRSNQIDVQIERNVYKDPAYFFATSLTKCSNQNEEYRNTLIAFFEDKLKIQLAQFNLEDSSHLTVLKQNLNSYIDSLTK